MARKLFCDMYIDLQERCLAALDHMLCWSTQSRFINTCYSYDVTDCPFCQNNNIVEFTWWNHNWLAIDADGQQRKVIDINLETLAYSLDWIERTYSPTHKCGDNRI